MRSSACGALAIMVLLSVGQRLDAVETDRAADWPGWLGADRSGVWRESGLIQKFSDDGPNVVWRVPLGTGYSGPAVADGRVYVSDRQRATDENGEPRRPTRAGIPGNERVLCFDQQDGKLIWMHEYDCPYTISYPTGPRTTPLVHEGRVYVLGAMGDLLCLDASDGSEQWAKNIVSQYEADPPVWGCAAHPLVDGELLICLAGGSGSAVVALDKNTGEEVWKALSTKEVGYSPPMIYELAGRRTLVIWLSEAIYGLDPATGEQLWKQDYPLDVPVQRPAVNIITVKQTGDDMLFISSFYHGPMMLKIGDDGASVVWRGKSNNPVRPDGAHCLMAAPVFKDGYGYAFGSNGDLRCFKQASGEELWQTYDPVAKKKTDCGTAFIVPQGDRYVLFNDSGELIFAQLTPEGYEEIDRAKILDAAGFARGRDIVWSHPAFAGGSVFARNDKEMVRVSLTPAG